MREKVFALLFGFALLTVAACDLNPPPERKSRETSSATTPATASPLPQPTARSEPTVAPTTAAPAATPVTPPEPPKKVAEIKIRDPEGVEFVRQHKWRVQEPNWSMLERMEHAENAPILDLVIMHSGVLTTAEDELEILQRIMAAHMNPISGRGWGDISAHYLIGPSGKVYQGRLIWYRADGSVGHGMGRFQYAWNKCSIMMLGDFNNPAQILTPEAQNALTTLIEDRRTKFARKYADELNARELETRSLLGSKYEGGSLGYDEIRVRKHPSLPATIQSFLDGNGSNTAGDGGTGSP